MREDALIGRQAQVNCFEEALTAARAGRGSILLITAEAGAGKTTLLERYAAIARAAGTPLAWTTVPDTEGAPPFWPWVEVLRSPHADATYEQLALAGAALIAPPVAGEDPAPARFRIFDQVARSLATPNEPLVILFDDMHRADGGTLSLLEFVAATLRRCRVVLVVAARAIAGDADAAATFGVLARAGAIRLDLPPWSQDEVERALSGAGVQASADFTRRVHTSTNGNPFFVLELAREATRAGDPREPTVPATVVDALRADLRRLDPAARDVLNLAATWGQDAPVAILAAAAGLSLDAIAQLVAPDFLAGGQSGALRFRHDLVREAVYAAISPHERQRLHARLAGAIDTSGMLPQERRRHLAIHGSRAGAAWDPPVAFERAVDAARADYARLGVESAVAFYALAEGIRPLLPPDAARDLAFFLAHGQALTSAGERARAAETLGVAAGIARSLGDAESLARVALFLGLGTETAGHPDRAAVRLIEEALAALPPTAHALRARLLARRAWQALPESAIDAGIHRLAHEAVAEARTSGDSAAIAYALSAYLLTILHDDLATCRAIAREITDQATQARDVDLTFSGLLAEFQMAMEDGDIAAARDAARRYDALAAEYPLPYHAWYRPVVRAALAFLDDRLDDARAAIATLDPDATTQREYAALLRATQEMELAARLDDRAALAEVSERVIAGLGGIWVEPAVRAHLAAAQGDGTEAARALARFVDTIAAGPRDDDWITGLVEAALAACALRARAAAAALFERLAPLAGRWPIIAGTAVSRGPVVGILAGLAALLGDEAGAAAFEARARAAAAAAGTPGALFWMETCQRYARRARAAGPAGLSAREAEVLALLATGCSNQEIADRLVLSIRTVQRHVENIYAKTGARGRAAAAVFAASHGIVASERG